MAADMSVYFGRSSDIRKLWDPTGGILATREIGTSTFRTGAGGARVSKALYGIRQYQLNYGALGRANFEYINAIHQGAFGVGPFVLLDPGRRNLLTLNQSSGTSQTNDTREFTVSGTGGSLLSAASSTSGFPKVLQWAFSSSAPATASLVLDKPSAAWPGIPIINRPYTFWCMMLAGVGSITVALRIAWFDISGNALSPSTSTAAASTTASWTLYTLTASPPATAVYARVELVPTVATIASGESLFISSMMFQEGDQKDPRWQAGTGVYPVQTISLPEQYGFAEPGMLVAPQLTLQEVR